MTLLNVQNLVKKFGSRKTARQICTIFLDESPHLVKEYRELTPANASLRDLAASAHRLKGSLGMIEQHLTRLAGSLERACLDGNEERAQVLYQRLDHGLEKLRQELEAFVAQSA